jgi:hypothetical protein
VAVSPTGPQTGAVHVADYGSDAVSAFQRAVVAVGTRGVIELMWALLQPGAEEGWRPPEI